MTTKPPTKIECRRPARRCVPVVTAGLVLLTISSIAHATQLSAVGIAFLQPPSVSTLMRATVDRPVATDRTLVHAIQADEFEIDEEKDKVSVTRAVGLSLLLPGLGHWNMGSRSRAGFFVGIEAIAWTTFAYFKTVEGQKEDDFQLLARTNAGIDPTGKDDEYYRTLTFYMSREQYNDEGRLVDPTRPYYPDDPHWDWQWDSEASMASYRTLRNQSNDAESRAKFSIGAAVVNRLVAAADAWRTARAVNREARMETAQWKVRPKIKASLSNPGFQITLSRKFY